MDCCDFLFFISPPRLQLLDLPQNMSGDNLWRNDICWEVDTKLEIPVSPISSATLKSIKKEKFLFKKTRITKAMHEAKQKQISDRESESIRLALEGKETVKTENKIKILTQNDSIVVRSLLNRFKKHLDKIQKQEDDLIKKEKLRELAVLEKTSAVESTFRRKPSVGRSHNTYTPSRYVFNNFKISELKIRKPKESNTMVTRKQRINNTSKIERSRERIAKYVSTYFTADDGDFIARENSILSEDSC